MARNALEKSLGLNSCRSGEKSREAGHAKPSDGDIASVSDCHSSLALMAFSPPIVPPARLAEGRIEVDGMGR
ncbi:hypothetical protein KKY_2181 [Pelagibacterium halotolerans B2]|uniref:Uncharacterized protein n=1 Tax=Pelagibacterium halotolerans (strain DSM 22347 / JCM 15775 / CGMCC 1.7692 / B2) TaxID=1082931 RepID=G4R6M8_PELHB|nr:hypothetical protein KKY_2181 [Pelagibacterium halotolerans B2]